jgi:hypothetical protein
MAVSGISTIGNKLWRNGARFSNCLNLRLAISGLMLGMTLSAPVSAQVVEDKFSAQSLGLKPDSYIAGWFIHPGEIITPAEPLKSLQVFLKTRLFPYKSYALDGEAPIVSSKNLLPVGTELVGFISHRPLGCTLDPVGKSAGQAILLKKGTKRSCYYDSDGDGAFDKSFIIDSKNYSFFHEEGWVPRESINIKPVAFHETDRTKSSVGRNLFLFYNTHHSWAKEFSIGYHLQKEDEFIQPADGIFGYDFKDKEIPLSVKLYGGSYRIEEMVEGRIRIRSEGPQGLTPIYLGYRCCI